ncbi:MAG: TatD family hydrolase [Dysgonomonas sp.]|nr:TatD family hydrolase [Dysgonomonas sp.]
MIIDTHSHIYDEKFDNDINEVIERALQAGISHILIPNIDRSTIESVNQLADKYPNYCIPMMGLHPTSVTTNWREDLSIIKNQFSKKNYIGIGEIGIDLYWDKTFEYEQKAAFEEQLRWSIELNLPVSIHSREAIKECIECINNVGASRLKGVFHSFGGNEEQLQEILKLKNFLIGINGTITYKNSSLPSVLKNTNLKHLIVETDAPYLPPVPHRGKRNEPSYTSYIIQKLAEIYNTSIEYVEDITTQNAKELYF